jgi:AAA+ ATPase superfamily predicted ATPase
MQSPFSFGRTVDGQGFTNRVADIRRLSNNLSNGINTILISPRRWGKSSLVRKVASDLHGRKHRVVQLDMMSIRTEEAFYQALAKEAVKATSGKLADWIKTAGDALKHISPKISIGPDPVQDFEISFEWKDIEKNYRELLNLPEQAAKKKNLHLIICIDEFQNCAAFDNDDKFQKKLRAEWQHHQHVTYCLYGSRQHMMSEMFESQSSPFYKFGDVIHLQKIARQDWSRFITEGFSRTHKSISPELASLIAELVQDHSYYVQQLAYLVWTSTLKKVTRKTVYDALDELLSQNAILYNRDTENLSGMQFNFLRAVANGVHTGLSSNEVMDEYRLGTSANVLKLKKALIQKELIEEHKGVHFLDPVYQRWFQRLVGADEKVI